LRKTGCGMMKGNQGSYSRRSGKKRNENVSRPTPNVSCHGFTRFINRNQPLFTLKNGNCQDSDKKQITIKI
jgi:hypothetical protein